MSRRSIPRFNAFTGSPVSRSLRRDIVLSPISHPLFRHYTTNARITHQTTGRSKWTRRLIWGLLFGSIGYYHSKAGIRQIIQPEAPGSRRDALKLATIRRKLEALADVQSLRADPDYVEWDAYEDLSDEDKETRLTSGPLKGSRGIAVQKIFWREEDQSCINIVHLGPSVEGWPLTVHGGALATLLDESLGRVAIRSMPAQTGVTAHLNINYHAPVTGGKFYMIRTQLDKERSTDRKAHVTGDIRDLSGKLYCTSDALFVVPKNMPLRRLVERF